MSYFAKSKCPHCGMIKQFHLGGLMWATEMRPFMTGKCVTVCKNCGREYDPEENCIECINDNDYPTPKTITKFEVIKDKPVKGTRKIHEDEKEVLLALKAHENEKEVILDADFINRVTNNDMKTKIEAVIKYLDNCARLHMYSTSKGSIVITSDKELNYLREDKILKKVKDIFRDERGVDLKYIGESSGHYHLVLEPLEDR